MRLLSSVFMVFLMVCALHGQVPQFSPYDFSGWVYNNPAIELNQSNIISNAVVLYVNSEGMALSLTSPPFNSRKGQTIDMDVKWITKFWSSEEFVTYKAGFTVALINGQGEALDSVTFTPTSLKRENDVKVSLDVSHTQNNAKLRFTSWKGTPMSSGAIRQIVASPYFKADVNLDGEVSLIDVNLVIDLLLSGDSGQTGLHADVNGDGEVTVADINEVINVILG